MTTTQPNKMKEISLINKSKAKTLSATNRGRVVRKTTMKENDKSFKEMSYADRMEWRLNQLKIFEEAGDVENVAWYKHILGLELTNEEERIISVSRQGAQKGS